MWTETVTLMQKHLSGYTAPTAPACSWVTEKSYPKKPILWWKDQTEKELPEEGHGHEVLSPFPQVLRAVVRGGRKMAGPPGSILGWPRASAGLTHPRPTWKDLLKSVHPVPQG